MTATDIRDALGPLAIVLAREAGWSRSRWYTAVSRAQALTREEREAFAAALSDHIATAQALRKRILSPSRGA